MGLTAIVKPTHDCNLACRYCYIDRNAEQGRMDYSMMAFTMESVVKVSPDNRAHFIWHGGEPLLMGLDFYREVSEVTTFLRKKGFRVDNVIQSNATLITEELLDLIQESRDFRLGLSLDGPKDINNRTRMYKDGSGAFEDIYRGVKMANDRNRLRNGYHVGGGVIVVLTRQNAQDIDKIYEFFKETKINIKVNPLMSCGSANINDLHLSPQEYTRAMKHLFDLWIDDTDTIGIDPFSEIMGNIATDWSMGCNYSESCRKRFISIGPQGDVYPCGRFDGDKQFWMGNLVTDKGLEKSLGSVVNKRLSERKPDNIPGCKDCKNKPICNGGCMHNAYLGGDVMGKDMFCSSYKQIIPHISRFVEQELKKAEQKRKNRESLLEDTK